MNIVTCISDLNPCPDADQRLLSLADALDPVSLGVDAETMLYVFSWGFATVLLFWSIGYGAALAIGIIKKI